MKKVTYIYHSSFLVETDTAVFLFDYYKGKLPVIKKEKKVYVFASHNHYDHFDKKVFELLELGLDITFILSKDIPKEVLYNIDVVEQQMNKIIFISDNEERNIEGCHVKTLRSTDEGVAFLIHYEEVSIYHAGDLQWWHWDGESHIYNEMMKRKYKYEIDKVSNEKIDIAFLVLDPRLEKAYSYGFDYFMKQIDVKAAFPMHLWGEYSTCNQLILDPMAKNYKTKIKIIEKKDQEFLLE